ncbi:hypothetical protein [Paenibacillus sp. 22594]|uniref:hypothetical protein n=1 Tax=Paenibacillus sp. 22594 TaxID=3453947 RepID=UPI003F85C4D3
MLIERKLKDSNVSILEYKDFYSIDIEELKGLFDGFKQNNIIQANTYEDDTWQLFNGKIKRNTHFTLDEVKFNRIKTIEMFSYRDIINGLKGFALYRLKESPVETVSSDISYLKKVINEINFFQPGARKILSTKKLSTDRNYYSRSYILILFLEFFPIPDPEGLIELLHYQSEILSSYRTEREGLNQRDIGMFESVFEFGYIMDLFWENCTPEEREEFYPIRIWWEVTTTIPLRVTELVLTPYGCLKQEGEAFYLTVRRTRLKGYAAMPVTHKIEEDYYMQDIQISEKLYRLLEEYRDIVDKYDFEPNYFSQDYTHTGRRSFLFSQRAYFKNLQFKGTTKTSGIMEFLNVGNLSYLLDRFFEKIICGRFNYQIIKKEKKKMSGEKSKKLELLPFQIQTINLMDTRHYAFINMALSEVEPIPMMKIAGHSSIRSSYHYFNHVSKFVQCYTYSMAKRIARQNKANEAKTDSIRNNNVESKPFKINYSNLKELAFQKVFDPDFDLSRSKDIKGGKCSSKQSLFEDCNKVGNDCDVCDFFHPIQTKAQNEIEQHLRENEKVINSEVIALKDMILQSEKIKNLPEVYGVKINKIKMIANQNATMLSKYFL